MPSWPEIFEVLKSLGDLGVAVAAWRLATKIDRRFTAHEKEDRAFHKEVRTRLNIPEPAEG